MILLGKTLMGPSSKFDTPSPTPDRDEEYALKLAVCSTFLAEYLAEQQGKEKRREKMIRVVDEKKALLRDTFFRCRDDMPSGTELLALMPPQPMRDQTLELLIDLSFSNPFAPYELKFDAAHLFVGLNELAVYFGLERNAVKNLRETRKAALKAHRQFSWIKIALFGGGGFAVFALGGYFLAPIIGTAIGAATGLYGAAATAHGLAILGGGSLALGGAGMAGGTWLVTSISAAIGATVLGGSQLLLALSSDQLRLELVKLQMNYKLILLEGQTHIAKAQEVISGLEEKRQFVEHQLEHERLLNDKNSWRLKELETKLQAIIQAKDWMEEQRKSA